MGANIGSNTMLARLLALATLAPPAIHALHAPRGPALAATQRSSARATQRSSSRAPAPEVASECGSLEECELEARELQDAARSLFAQAADLRTEARRDEITLHKQTVERASNNIIELTPAASEAAEAGAAADAWHTTLRVIEEETAKRGRLLGHQIAHQRAVLRVAWTFLAGGEAEADVAPAREDDEAFAAVPGKPSGWTIHRNPRRAGSTYVFPHILEAWTWIARSDGVPEKLLLRTTLFGLEAAQQAVEADAAARADAKRLAEEARDLLREHRWNWADPIKTVLSWTRLGRAVEKRELASAVAKDRAELARCSSGREIALDGETFVVGKIGDYRFERQDLVRPTPGPAAAQLLGRVLPMFAPPPPRGRFTAW